MKTSTRIKLIEEALSQEETIECAWILSEADINTVPVYAKFRDWSFKNIKKKSDKKKKEKVACKKLTSYDKKLNTAVLPEGHKGRPYSWSAVENLGSHCDWEEFEYAWHDERIGVGVCTQPEKSLFIIDADTPEELKALHTWWEDTTGESLPEPTVKTPGKYNEETKVWDHKDGGHWYLLMPEGMYSPGSIRAQKQGVTVSVGDSHFAIRAGNLYVLAPPTVRTDGEYLFHGDIISAEEWGIVNDIQELLIQKPEENKKSNYDFTTVSDIFYDDGESLTSRIAKWVESGADLQYLFSSGFSENNSHQCGGTCIEAHWKRSSDSRSVTFHMSGCPKYVHGQVSIWSDTVSADFDVPQNRMTNTWRLVERLKYGGDQQACIHGEGLHIERTAKGRKNDALRRALGAKSGQQENRKKLQQSIMDRI